MKNGKYKTKNGSTLELYNGRAKVKFDWLEEENACCDCEVEPYPSENYLVWNCDYCGGGSAVLMEMESNCLICGEKFTPIDSANFHCKTCNRVPS